MSIAQYIDHTALKNTTSIADIEKLCTEAMEYNFAAVCVPPYFVTDASAILNRSNVKVATVIGFPFGYNDYRSKLYEAQCALNDGADELDMVMNIAAFKSNDIAYLEAEVNDISKHTSSNNKILKVIIESGILTDEEIIRCCDLYRHFPVNFLKTSTGYSETGATIHAVRIMKQHLPVTMQIKASGGIRDFKFANQLIEAGATRLGCSAGIAIVKGETASGTGY